MVALIDPTLLPGGLLILGLILPTLTVVHEWRQVAWSKASWLVGARVLTTPLGVLLLVWLPPSAIGAVVGVLVLAAIGLTTWRFEIRATRPNLVVAGAFAGVFGTAASIAGPPAAVVLQHEPGARLRATLGAFFLAGSTASLTALAIGGQLTRHQVVHGASWIPAVILGFCLAVPLQRRIRPTVLRPAVLGLAALSSVAVIVKSVL